MAQASSLRFHGNGAGDIDRVKIRVDDPATNAPGPPADVGATDFTIELWLRATAADNAAPAVSCGFDINWIFGNIVLDRDRYNQDRKFGLSIAGGRLVWGMSGDGTGDFTICGGTGVLDGVWHHVAIARRRADGWLWLWVDGQLDAQGDGPDGDVSYPDDGVPGDFCGGPCVASDPFLVIGAEKHDAGPAYPSFNGWIDDVRISGVLRYTGAFVPPAVPLAADAQALALYALDEGAGDAVYDGSGAAGGPSHGVRRFGGEPAGPEWSSLTPFAPPPTSPGIVNQLRISKPAPAEIELTWGPSCSTEASDYAVYQGSLGAWYSHVPAACSTGGATSTVLAPGPGGRYFLVVARSGNVEGGYGFDSAGARRPRSASGCTSEQDPAVCP